MLYTIKKKKSWLLKPPLGSDTYFMFKANHRALPNFNWVGKCDTIVCLEGEVPEIVVNDHHGLDTWFTLLPAHSINSFLPQGRSPLDIIQVRHLCDVPCSLFQIQM